jgi:hypothetical protein
MTRRTALVFALGILLGPAPILHAYVGPLDLIVPGLPSPTDVVKLLDLLTQKDSSTSMDVKVGTTVHQGKLLVARTRVDVAMERSSRNWRGRVVVKLSVPSDISYSVDLSKIRAEHIRLDADRRQLVVAMPTPEVEAVTPLLSAVRIDDSFRRARFKRFDRDTSRELQNVMLREDYQARARQSGVAQVPQVREQGKSALQAFLQKLLGGAFPGIAVVVE